jgi:hypothetical protein
VIEALAPWLPTGADGGSRSEAAESLEPEGRAAAALRKARKSTEITPVKSTAVRVKPKKVARRKRPQNGLLIGGVALACAAVIGSFVWIARSGRTTAGSASAAVAQPSATPTPSPAPAEPKPTEVALRTRVATLPLTIYDEAGDQEAPYTPSGWMGNYKFLKLVEDCTERPHKGRTCLRLTYEAQDGWAGIIWQSPANDWGDRAGGWYLTGAKRLKFWARGAAGGETVAFEFGILKPGEKPYHDSAGGKLPSVELTPEWKEYSFDLVGKDMNCIKTGFGVVITGKGTPTTIFLDDVRYE